ncbi:tetratricopeptide repeat protein [Motiliproteus sp. SC1-56]|uniref:tetratricopeptide repeat protein n=1 Tax=Motiliproteus sp. SC1-56 TaxID=2799565 RepID=UPI001A8ECF28|nr:tetratricopeptide repeat protein [Motiliproteus sp. SC1-56]
MSRGWLALALIAALFSGPASSLPAQTADASGSAQRCYDYRYGGDGLLTDYRQSLKHCRQAAEQGSANAQTLLAELYFLGLGSAQDLAGALHWYTQAALQGHAHAQLMLHEMYRLGLGTVRNPQAARYWLHKAAVNGHPQALAFTATAP